MQRHKKERSQRKFVFSAAYLSLSVSPVKKAKQGFNLSVQNPQVAICAQVLNVAFANLIKTVHHKSARLFQTCGKKSISY